MVDRALGHRAWSAAANRDRGSAPSSRESRRPACGWKTDCGGRMTGSTRRLRERARVHGDDSLDPSIRELYGTIGNEIEKLTEPDGSRLPSLRAHTPSLKFGLTFAGAGVNVNVFGPQSRTNTHVAPLNIHHLN
jgi:hypothetical protein